MSSANTLSNEIERNVGKIKYRFFKSHLGKLCLKTVFALSLTPFISIFFSVCLWIVLIIDTIKNRNKLLFDIFFIYTVKTGGNDWWTPITDKIILGAIPLESHSERIQRSQISHILTLLEPFELIPGMITPIHKKTLEKSGIENKIVPCQDFLGVPADKINQAVEYIHSTIHQNDHKIYVHCKAGRGRSATVVVAYLLKYGDNGRIFKDFEEAYLFVKSKRPKINLNANQQKAIEDYHLEHGRMN